MTQLSPAAYECDGCGACCGAYLIFASMDDAAREPRIPSETRKLAGWLETPQWAYQLYPLPFLEACCFLDADRRCTIYETRPVVCREFAAGSEPCQQARAMKCLPPLSPIDLAYGKPSTSDDPADAGDDAKGLTGSGGDAAVV